MMKFLPFFFVVALMVEGCETVSDSLSSTGSHEYEGEKVDGQETKIVRYNPHGLDALVEQRRKSALKKVEEDCNGQDSYEIISEEISESGRDRGQTIDTFGTDTLMYIEYRCKDKG